MANQLIVFVFWQTLLTVFLTVFLAEVGDKTQLATLLFSTDEQRSKWAIFFGSSLALILAAGIGVLVGSQIAKFLSPDKIKLAAGIAFILVGVWTIFSK